MIRCIRRTITVTICESLTLVWSQPDPSAVLRTDSADNDTTDNDTTVSISWSVTKVSTHVNTFSPVDSLRSEIITKPFRTAD